VPYVVVYPFLILEPAADADFRALADILTAGLGQMAPGHACEPVVSFLTLVGFAVHPALI